MADRPRRGRPFRAFESTPKAAQLAVLHDLNRAVRYATLVVPLGSATL